MTVRLRNISPLGQIDLPLAGRQSEPIGEHGAGCLEPGEVFEVSDDAAGRAPSWRPVAPGVTYPPGTAYQTIASEPGQDGETEPARVEFWDLGEGLLAQVGNFEAVGDTAPGGSVSVVGETGPVLMTIDADGHAVPANGGTK